MTYKLEIENVLRNRILEIGDKKQLYTGTPEQLINELAEVFDQQLHQARKDWLRDEIVKLEGMEDSGTHLTGCRISHIHLEVSSCTCGIYNRGYNQAIDSVVNRYKQELDN